MSGHHGLVKVAERKPTHRYFSWQHPMARTVAFLCDHHDRPLVGGAGCGPCWELAIRRGQPMDVDPMYFDLHPGDDMVVELVLGGQYQYAQEATPEQRHEICRRWWADGRSLALLCDLTGWKSYRYLRVTGLASG